MTRQEIWNQIEEHREDLLKLCSQMIQIPSVNPPGDVSGIVRFITNYLEEKHIVYEKLLYLTATVMWSR